MRISSSWQRYFGLPFLTFVAGLYIAQFPDLSEEIREFLLTRMGEFVLLLSGVVIAVYILHAIRHSL